MLTTKTTTLYQHPSLSIFNLEENEIEILVPSEGHRFFKPHDTLHLMRHSADTVNDIMKSWKTWSWWLIEVGRPALAEIPFWTKSYHVIMSLICLFLAFHYCMICHHDTQNQIGEKIYGIDLDKKFKSSFPLRQRRIYPVILYKSNMGISFVF